MLAKSLEPRLIIKERLLNEHLLAAQPFLNKIRRDIINEQAKGPKLSTACKLLPRRPNRNFKHDLGDFTKEGLHRIAKLFESPDNGATSRGQPEVVGKESSRRLAEIILGNLSRAHRQSAILVSHRASRVGSLEGKHLAKDKKKIIQTDTNNTWIEDASAGGCVPQKVSSAAAHPRHMEYRTKDIHLGNVSGGLAVGVLENTYHRWDVRRTTARYSFFRQADGTLAFDLGPNPCAAAGGIQTRARTRKDIGTWVHNDHLKERYV